MSHSPHARQTRTRLVAASTVLVLLAGACGDSSGNDITADADSAGVARNFCDAVADLGTTIQTSATPTDQAAAAAAALELMPTDAPDFAVAYFDSIAETYRLSLDGGDTTDAEASWANGQHLQVATFLGSECPDGQYASAANFQGMVAMGMDMQANGAGAMTSNPDSTDTTSESAATTETAVGSASNATDDEDAAAPVSAGMIELGESANSATYYRTEITTGPAFSINAERNTIFDAAPEPGNENWLVLEILGETKENISTSFPGSVFSLVNPDGQAMTAEALTDRFGDTQYDLSFDGLENKSAFALFQTPELVTSLEGWQLRVLTADEIPAFIPLSGETTVPTETIDIGSLLGGTTTGENYYNDNLGCVSTLQVDVISAVIDIDASYSNRLHRSRKGERFLQVEVDVTNTTDESIHENCDNIGTNIVDPQLRIAVDGRNQGPVVLSNALVNPGETTSLDAVYIIDAGATEITLVGIEDSDVFGTWQIDIPALPGE